MKFESKLEAIKCPRCGYQVYRNSSGILMHTTPAEGEGAYYLAAEICPGSTRGARA